MAEGVDVAPPRPWTHLAHIGAVLGQAPGACWAGPRVLRLQPTGCESI